MTIEPNLTADDIIKLFHIKSKYPRQTVCNWCKAGEFPGAFKACNQWLIPESAVKKFKEARAA